MDPVYNEQGRYESCSWRTVEIWALSWGTGEIWDLFIGNVVIWVLFIGNRVDIGPFSRE